MMIFMIQFLDLVAIMENNSVYTNYIVFSNGEVIDESLPGAIRREGNSLYFSGYQKTDCHIFLNADHIETDINYYFAPSTQVNLVETRLLNNNAVLNRKLVIGENAQINIFNENHSDDQSLISFNDYGETAANASVQIGYAELSDASIRGNAEYSMNGENAQIRLRMAALSDSNEEKYYRINLISNAPGTIGIMDNYGVSKDSGKMTIDGIGTIKKGMHKSESHQTNKIIVFDEDAYASANPYLLIDDYDVAASHAAGVGKMDASHLYYLESRGLSKRQAMQLITYGYLKPVVDIVDNEMIKSRFEHSLSKVGA